MERILGVIVIALMLAGCANVHHVTPATFEANVRNMNTFFWCDYIGQADGKAFLLRKRAPLIGETWKEDVLFTETKGVDQALLKWLEDKRMKGTSNQVSEAIGAPGAPQPQH